MRIAGVVIAALLLVAGAALYFSHSRVSSLLEAALGIKAAAEWLLTEAAGAPVTIESIDLALADGELTIQGLTVANPEGFHTPHALEAGEVRIAMELATLLEDTVVVREIAVRKPLFSYEIGRDGSNLDAIRRNVDSFAGAGREGVRSDAPARRLLVENLHVREGRVAASAVFLEGRSWEVPLPELNLRNLSSGEDGAAAGIVKEVTAEVARKTRESVAPIRELAGKIGDRIADRASKTVEGLKKELEKGSGSARETLEQGSESVRETLKEKAGTARETVEKGAESARKALDEGAESTREALEKGVGSARDAFGKGTEKVRKTFEKLLGKRTE